MTRKIDIDRIRVASPCHVRWDSMVGDDRARLCGSCDRHVYNIVRLSRTEIESLIENTEGRLCVRMYQRADETVLTQNCPVGLRALRKRFATFAGAALSALLGLVSIGYGQKPADCSDSNSKVVERVKFDSKFGQISGLIVDMNGAVVPGVSIKLQLHGRVVARAASDAEGTFTFPEIKPAARYALRIVGEQGWKKLSIKEITVNEGEKVSYAVCLQADNVDQVVGLLTEPSEIL